ncbi:MAG TPA: hypothetical protein VHO72_03965 [Bacteroidales bacterium]|nr:hypothetical protein [Bacteroidales bacterium]
MKAASLSELKSELKALSQSQLLDICLQFAKYKKENKELLTYLLYEANDESVYIKNIKEFIADEFENVNKTNIYYAKKSIRKILRLTSKYIKYSGSKQTEVELLIFFCKQVKGSGVSMRSSTALANLYQRQIEKIKKALDTLHEDLQYDYKEDIASL